MLLSMFFEKVLMFKNCAFVVFSMVVEKFLAAKSRYWNNWRFVEFFLCDIAKMSDPPKISQKSLKKCFLSKIHLPLKKFLKKVLAEVVIYHIIIRICILNRTHLVRTLCQDRFRFGLNFYHLFSRSFEIPIIQILLAVELLTRKRSVNQQGQRSPVHQSSYVQSTHF